MEYTKATKEIKPQISQIFVEGFYQWLRFFSKDKVKLTNAFAHMFNTDCFFIAAENGSVTGISFSARRQRHNVTCEIPGAQSLREVSD